MSDLRTALADALGPLYRVEREVRPVGEYRLFVATLENADPASLASQPLLIKVLPAALSLGINDLHFERAVLLLAEMLHHPNLVRPRGAGRAGPFAYHTRPFVHGTTLRAWIGNGDLKAENILLADEGILVADTGIAAALGKPATARNDMAALQALVREMLTGRRPSRAEEPVQRARTLPAWFSEWMGFRWSDAGKALAAMRPPPPPSSHSSQLFA